MFRFLAVITASEVIGRNWQDDLRNSLKEWGLALVAGDLVLGGERCGPYSFHTMEELSKRFGDAPWLKVACPYVGPALGAISWERRESYCSQDEYFPVVDWTSLRPPLRDLLIPFMKEARGAIVRTTDGAYREPVRLRTYLLRHAIGKYGCGDGTELLTCEQGAYFGDVLARIAEALRGQGLSGHVGWTPTSHNPIQFSGVEVRGLFGGKTMRAALWRGDDWQRPPVHDTDAALGDLSVQLWAYDFSICDELSFFATDSESS